MVRRGTAPPVLTGLYTYIEAEQPEKTKRTTHGEMTVGIHQHGPRSTQQQAGRVRGRAVSGSEKDRYRARGPRENRGPQMDLGVSCILF